MTEPHEPRHVSRRTLFRLAGAAAVATAAVTLATPESASASDSSLRWCAQCRNLFAGSANGECVVGPVFDHVAGGTQYILKNVSDGGLGQSGWTYCLHCASVYFPGSSHAADQCVVTGSDHVPADPVYRIEYQPSQIDGSGHTQQPGWRWCMVCEDLFYGPQLSSTGCWPAGGATHPHTPGGTVYVVRHL